MENQGSIHIKMRLGNKFPKEGFNFYKPASFLIIVKILQVLHQQFVTNKKRNTFIPNQARMKLFFYCFIVCLFFTMPLRAQNITGTWEGSMGNQFLQLNVTQKGSELCGYTWDSVKVFGMKSYCKAYYSGSYDKSKKEWQIIGTNFIEQRGGHMLMRLRFWQDPNNEDILIGTEMPGKGILGLLSMTMAADRIVLKRVSDKPRRPGIGKGSCFEEQVNKTDAPDPRDKVPTPTRPRQNPPPINPVPKPVIKDSTPKPVIVAPPVVKVPEPKPVENVLEEVNKRKNKAFKTLQVNTKKITLDVYDNGTIDGDTVSIIYNGRLLMNKKRLSASPLRIDLELDENAGQHEITLFAENLGSIPPNTALIVVTAGGKRYELFSSASLQENAVLVIEYKP